MSCTNPRPAVLVPADTKTGRRIKFLHPFKDAMTYLELLAKYGDDYVEIPCGKCDSCIEQRTKSWAIRCCLGLVQLIIINTIIFFSTFNSFRRNTLS